jgi:hypothetical protein
MADVIPIYPYTILTAMRWDNLAYFGYGDVGYTPDLVEANPQIPSYDWVPAGVVVLFPYIPEAALNTIVKTLPIWKQDGNA